MAYSPCAINTNSSLMMLSRLRLSLVWRKLRCFVTISQAPVWKAKFSLQFAVASALVEGAVGLNQLTDQVVAKDDVREQFSKLKISINEQNCPIEPAFSYADRVRLKLRNRFGA